MRPKGFERFCERRVKRWFRDFKVECQASYIKDGKRKRIDILISEKEDGGKCYVIDCKHFRSRALNEYEINSTLEYKMDKEASAAIILISGASKKFNPGFESYSRSMGVPVIRVNTTLLLNRIANVSVKRKLRRIVVEGNVVGGLQ